MKMKYIVYKCQIYLFCQVKLESSKINLNFFLNDFFNNSKKTAKKGEIKIKEIVIR